MSPWRLASNIFRRFCDVVVSSFLSWLFCFSVSPSSFWIGAAMIRDGPLVRQVHRVHRVRQGPRGPPGGPWARVGDDSTTSTRPAANIKVTLETWVTSWLWLIRSSDRKH